MKSAYVGTPTSSLITDNEPPSTGSSAETASLTSLFEAQVDRAPHAVALTLAGRSLTYAELDERANRLANHLQSLGVGPEVLVGLSAPRSLEMVVAIIGILKAGGAYLPLDPEYPEERLAFMLEDARAPVLVTAGAPPAGAGRARVVSLDADAPELQRSPATRPAPAAGPHNLAYVIYTSGSTGRPKGVMVEHGNVTRLFTATAPWFDFDSTDTFTLFHSYAFDFSVWEIWGALLHGGRLVLVPHDVARSPTALHELLRRERVTVLCQTPSAFKQLVRAEAPLPDTALAELGLRFVIFGGEALDPGDLQPFQARRAAAAGPRLVNMYGITETTVHVTYHLMTPADAPGKSIIGRPLPDLQLHLLDPARLPVSQGEPGEIWVGGAGVARGYLDRPELTAERFAEGVVPGGSGRLYRTGDIARLLPSGDYEYLGRADDQVKIRGHRIELGEVLAAVTAHPDVREAIVVAREDSPGEKRLVAYILPRAEGPRPGALRHFVAQRLPEHMVPAAFLSLARFPLAPSGKVDRRALPAPGRGRPALSTDYAPPSTPDEQILAAVWAEILGLDAVGIDDDFFELGGDSLLAVRITVRAREALGREIALQSLFESPTVKALSAGLSAAASAPVVPLLARPRPASIPLSFAQQRLWFLHQLAPTAGAYNLPCTLRLTGPLDIAALEQSLDAVIARHEALRTTFASGPEGPTQLIGPAYPVRLERADLSAIPTDSRPAHLEARCVEEFSRPFDLTRGPLLRAVLIRLAAEDHALLLPTHHIVSDGWSMGILIRELAALYEAFREGRPSPLAPLEIQYADWALSQRAEPDQARMAAHLAHFREELLGAPLVHELPTDRPRPAVPSRRGAQERFTLDASTSSAIGTLARAEGATPFMVLLAAFTSLLHRLSGQEDIVVGTPTAGRSRREIEPLIGFFAGTVVLRARLRDAPTFRRLVAQIRERALDAFAHEDVPFEHLVAALRPDRDPRYSPLFQILFALQNPPPDALTASGLRLSLSQRDNGASAFDLVVQLWETGSGLEGTIAYDTDLFDAPSIRRLAADYRAHLASLLAHPDLPADSLSPSDSPAAIEAALLRDPALADVAVRRRNTLSRDPALIAYVVASGSTLPSLSTAPALSPGAPPLLVAPIGALPLTPRGDIDEAALQRTPILDEATITAAEAALRAWPGVSRAVALARDVPGSTSLLHLADLLPPALDRASSIPPSPRADDTPPPVSLVKLARSRPMALVDGGPLVFPEGDPRTLSAALARAAASSKGISYLEDDGAWTEQSYADLEREALQITGGLARAGVRPGDRVLLQLPTLRAHFTAFWACLLGGVIPATVAIAPSYEVENAVVAKLFNAWRLLDRPAILTSEDLAPSLQGLKALFPMDGLAVHSIESLARGVPAERVHPSLPSDVAFLQLSSGSTGLPKAVQITHQGVVHHAQAVTQHNGYSREDVSLNWLAVDHVVAMLTCHLKDVYLACAQIQIKTDLILADPLRLLDVMQERRVTHLFSPNFGFKLVTSRLEARPEAAWDLRAIKRITNGGEQATLPVIRDFLRLTAPFGVTPRVMQPAFGMAESCTGITYNNDFDLATSVHRVAKSSLGGVLEHTFLDAPGSIPFIDLGPPIPGVKIRIVDADDCLVPQGVIGRMQIRGVSVTPGYVNHPEANREAFTHDSWFNSGDLGFLQGDRLTLTGREKETIIVRGANFYCHEIEDVVSTVPGVVPTFAAACASEDAEAGTEGVAIFFVSADPALAERARVAAAVRARVTERLGVTPSHVIPLARDLFPKTTSGKLQRSDLGRALAAGRYTAIEREIDLHLENDRTVPDWFHRKVWRRKAIFAAAPRIQGAITLIFLDAQGLGARVTAALEADGRRVITVTPDVDFQAIAPDRYRLDPTRKEHYEQLLALIAAESLPRRGDQQVAPTQSEIQSNGGTGDVLVAPTQSEIQSNGGTGDVLVAPTQNEIQSNAGRGDLLVALPGSVKPGGHQPLAQAALESILHLTTYDGLPRPISEDASAWQGLLYFVQALAALESPASARLLVVSSDAQPVLPGDRISLDKAPLFGLVQTIPQEYPHLSTSHLDLPSGDIEMAVTAVLAEERAAQRDREVAYRGAERLIPALETVDFAGAPLLPPPFETGGVYLLAGGLGGIGARLAEHLLSQHRARVLVLGRSSLADVHASPRGLALQELEAAAARSGGEIVYESADVTDPLLVGDAVRRAEQRWSRPLAGIVHLAGVFEERRLLDETPESFSATLRPKLLGARALGSLLTSRPRCLFIAFSSVNSFFGGLSASAYASASRALEHFIHELRRAGYARAHALVWSAWDEIGLSRGYRMKEHSRARGFHAVSALKGQASILVALRRSEGSLFIGLDSSSPRVHRHLSDAARAGRPIQELTACIVPAGDTAPLSPSLSLRDRFGALLSCSVRPVTDIPLQPDGTVDTRALLLCADGSARPATDYVAPRGEAEAVIAGIWRDALRVDRVGSDDNFFDLGGHSMLLAVVRDKLARAFGRDVPIVEMFRHPTVAALAAHLARDSQSPAANPRSGDLDERARKQRAALDHQRRRALPRRKNDV